MFDTKHRVWTSATCGTVAGMEFVGRIYFKFDCGDAWLFYRFVRALAESGANVALEWSPMPTPETELAVSVHERLESTDARGRFLHAMFGLVHIQGLDVSDPTTVSVAIESAGLGEVEATIDRRGLDRLNAQITDLGVTWSPSLYRHGPVTAITLNPAVLTGNVQASATSILRVADDDGIWELAKP